MERLHILTPISGAMMGDCAGKFEGDALLIDLAAQTFAGHALTVNGLPMEDHAGVYTALIPLTAYRNEFTICDATNGDTVKAVYYRLKNDSKKYRLSLDDNIWFFQDIAKNGYRSLFENPYLGLMRSMHEKYGTKVHINCYYCCPEHGGFNLTQFPDRYKGEWKENADWLRLSFHAFKNIPDRPYVAATYDTAFGDCEMVKRELLRIAGEDSMSDYTTIHWCEGTSDACRAFRANGYKALQAGLADREEYIKYYLDVATFEGAVYRYGYWKDEERDVIVSRNSICLNTYTPEQIPVELDRDHEEYPLAGFADMVIHEQYFYTDYVRYLPDYAERVEAGIRWCVDHGYQSSFRSEPLRPW